MAGAKKIGSIYAELSVKDKMTVGLNKAGKSLKDFEKKAMKKVGGMAATGAAASLAAVTAGMVIGTKGALAMADDLADMSAQTGIAISSLMRLGQAYKDNGKDAASVGKDINKMQKALSTGAADKALAELGLNTKELLALSPDQQFFKIGEAIKGIQDPAKKAALSMAIFGKSGGELLAVFAGSDLDDVNKTLGEMPLLVEKFAAEMGRANDLIDRMKGKSDQFFVGFTIGIIDELLPALEKLNATDMTEWGQDAAESFMNAAKHAKIMADVLSAPLKEIYRIGEAYGEMGIAAHDAIFGAGQMETTAPMFNIPDDPLEVASYVDPNNRPNLQNKYMDGVMTDGITMGDPWDDGSPDKIPDYLDKDWREAALKKADALSEYSHELAKLEAEQRGDSEGIKRLEREYDLRQKINELVESGVDQNDAVEMANKLSAAQAALDDMETTDKPSSRNWEETAYQVNDYQSRGLGLSGATAGKSDEKKVTLLTSIRDILKDASKNDKQQVWNL